MDGYEEGDTSWMGMKKNTTDYETWMGMKKNTTNYETWMGMKKEIHHGWSAASFGGATRICLLAFIVLVKSNNAHDEIVPFFAIETEYTNELIKIVRSEETISGTIKTLFMLALAAQLAAYSSSHDRSRIMSESSIIVAGRNRMILLNVLQKVVSSMKSSNDPSTLSLFEALLQFYMLHRRTIRGSIMVQTLLPILQDIESAHMHLVCLTVKALQKLMDYSNAGVSLLKDLGGVELLAQKLHIEVNRVIGLSGPSDNSIIVEDITNFDDDHLYAQKRLIKTFL
ncbi:E3 ubiquitin-protein ligase UPL1-like [Papaver somniferum]|uniref:E3 ubiquitin-protein ligase UPL1-like n=1 Tax=Papaver somniferum TaxID=3469 RepID=UPI000E6F5E3E|nr:E3 ubiquitin-protein ligase UPL1-like [Papaver somniferum]